jgi:hypothetical protein
MQVLPANLDVLPARQRQLWGRLDSTPSHFVLYGGTALALQLGHRESIDFDFFSSRTFAPLDLSATIDYLRGQAITQQEPNTLSCEVAAGAGAGAVKVSFFGGLTLGQINAPARTGDNRIAVASLLDVFGTKCATISQRNETKDYLDIHALITLGRLSLTDGLAGARAIYGLRYSPLLTLEALVFFDDLTDAPPLAVQSDLRDAVKSVSLERLPTMTSSGPIGAVEQ